MRTSSVARRDRWQSVIPLSIPPVPVLRFLVVGRADQSTTRPSEGSVSQCVARQEEAFGMAAQTGLDRRRCAPASASTQTGGMDCERRRLMV